MNVKTYSKAIAAAAGALSVIGLALGDGEVSPGEWGQIIASCATVYGVWKARNAPQFGRPQPVDILGE